MSDLVKALEKWEFILDWILSESRDSSMIRYLNESYLQKRQARARIKL